MQRSGPAVHYAELFRLRQIERGGGRIYLGSIPWVHYAEMLRLRRLKKMDDQAWDSFVRAYLSHRYFSKFKGSHGLTTWSPFNWFFEIIDNATELTRFHTRRRQEMVLLSQKFSESTL